MPDPSPARTAVLVKGYPRISETFVAKELLGLQERGLRFLIVSLRHPTDRVRHDLHERITAPVVYLPEYLHHEPLRVLRRLPAAARLPGFAAAVRLWLRDLARDPTPNRVRRMGQAIVLAAELPADVDRLYAHFIHTPGSVARYAARMRGLPFSLSAHARDIWTIPDWEKREKLRDAAWTVTCTAVGADHLRSLAPSADIELVHHGVDTTRFRPPDRHDASGPATSVPTILSVARCVPKKGLHLLLEALARLPRDRQWRHVHVGGGPLRDGLVERAATLGLAGRTSWLGARPQLAVVELMRSAGMLCLPSRIAEDQDRDGLPNVLLEAMACGLPVIATTVGAVSELVHDGHNGLLVPPDDPAAIAEAIARLLRDPDLRTRLGRAGRATVVERFGEAALLDRLAIRLGIVPRLVRAA